MNRTLNNALAGLCLTTVGLLASAASAQVPTLVNGDLNTPDAYLQTFNLLRPQGWRLYNFSEYRMIGDSFTPTTQTHSGDYSVRLPGGMGRAAGEFEAVHAEEPIDYSNVLSPRNWPQYTYNQTTAPPLKLSCWFMIPASDPLVNSRFGMKLGLIRNGTADNGQPDLSHFADPEWLLVDPTAATAFPGCTIVQDVAVGDGSTAPGIHTNGQWVKFEQTYSLSSAGSVQNPPTSPAAATIMALRYDIFTHFNPDTGAPICPCPYAQGTVWVDDLAFSQGSACPADFNGNGTLEVQDIFDFLNAWFAGNANADFNGGGLAVQDIFDFLNAWFSGCH